MFDRFAEIDKKKEELERKKNARPDAMNHIDEWEGKVNGNKMLSLNSTSGGRSDGTGIATDPNSIKVGGDIKMDLDLNEAIKEDAKLQEDST